MAESSNIVKQKGRPVEIADGADKFLGLRLPGILVKKIDAWAKRAGTRSRSEAVRALIERGLGK